LGISRTTASTWVRRRNPSVPDPVILIQLARKTNINLNWLLTGEGHELQEHYWGDSPIDHLETIVESELRSTEGLTTEEFAAAWDRMKFTGDFMRRQPKDHILKQA